MAECVMHLVETANFETILLWLTLVSLTIVELANHSFHFPRVAV